MSPRNYSGRFIQAYLKCALWSSCDYSEEGQDRPLDESFTVDDISDETFEAMKGDCLRFILSNRSDLRAARIDPAQAGCDFWLTREGHGAGFWDRGLGEIGDRLTKASKVFGSFHLYVNEGSVCH